MEDMKCFEIVITGRVQGVGFRYTARKMARSLRLRGWVENRADGSVFCCVEGKEKDCHEFIRWCGRGSGYSWVEKVDTKECEPHGFDSFRVRF